MKRQWKTRIDFPVEQVVTEPGTAGARAIKRSKLEPGVLARVPLRCDFGSHSSSPQSHPPSPSLPHALSLCRFVLPSARVFSRRLEHISPASVV